MANDKTQANDPTIDKSKTAAEIEAGAPTVKDSTEASGQEAQTVAEAKTLVVPDADGADMDSGHWRAQKFGNDPANPQPALGLKDVAEEDMVKLTRLTPDLPNGEQVTYVHPQMVGDYERAGWNRAG